MTDEQRFIDDYLQQPVSDEGPLPKFCKAHHCTETRKQEKCPYCHGKEGLDAGFHANAVIGKDESGKTSICVETLEQTFYIPIKLCPMCGRKLEA